MKKPILEVIRFEEPDIIATSGLGMTMSNFGDQVPNNGTFSFFGGSSGDESHNAHEENIVSEFNSYFGWDWKDLDEVTLNFADGDNGLGEVVDIDYQQEQEDIENESLVIDVDEVLGKPNVVKAGCIVEVFSISRNKKQTYVIPEEDKMKTIHKAMLGKKVGDYAESVGGGYKILSINR